MFLQIGVLLSYCIFPRLVHKIGGHQLLPMSILTVCCFSVDSMFVFQPIFNVVVLVQNRLIFFYLITKSHRLDMLRVFVSLAKRIDWVGIENARHSHILRCDLKILLDLEPDWLNANFCQAKITANQYICFPK